jgi:hypothetical protein
MAKNCMVKRFSTGIYTYFSPCQGNSSPCASQFVPASAVQDCASAVLEEELSLSIIRGRELRSDVLPMSG